jgi:hypothetical protein
VRYFDGLNCISENKIASTVMANPIAFVADVYLCVQFVANQCAEQEAPQKVVDKGLDSRDW